jgi:hypothetical protein
MTLRSVGQALEAFAEEHDVPAAEVITAQLEDHLEPSLPPRYRRLAAEVLLRLPDGWDSHAHWTMGAGDIPSEVDIYEAGARRLEGDLLQRWDVRLVPQMLDKYPDAAIRWVIAHELAHVATGLPSDPLECDDALCEDRADHLAALWGFQEDRDAYEAAKGVAP